MIIRTCIFAAVLILVAISLQYRAEAQTSYDPLRHGHALLIGNSHYRDPGWPQLDDIPLQLDALQKGLQRHFDTVDVVQDLETEQLRQKINSFLQTFGNDSNARLFIYYAGHGYTEVISQRNENRGYITGIDTPKIDGRAATYNAARLKAISMAAIRAPLEDVLAKSILVLFDSCFAGTIFTDRAGGDTQPLIPDVVDRLLETQARDFITAGRANQRVPAHSPIPELFLAAINGAADRYQHGVISSGDIYQYLFDHVIRIRDFQLTPQMGKLPNPAFAEGSFLFRVTNPLPLQPNDNETIRLYRADAANQNVKAQVDLAYLYHEGKGGVVKDDVEAARLYKLAADRGNADGQAGLAYLYQLGLGGLTKDDREAARLFKLAADQGNANGQSRLAYFYQFGLGGLTKDDREAARLYKLAADQGNADGQARLAYFYQFGLGGLTKDDREAARLYKLAADQGNTYSQTALSKLIP